MLVPRGSHLVPVLLLFSLWSDADGSNTATSSWFVLGSLDLSCFSKIMPLGFFHSEGEKVALMLSAIVLSICLHAPLYI